MPAIERFLVQAIEEKAPLDETLRAAGEIAGVPIPEEELAHAAVQVQA
jgi:hypothetical protein